MPDWGLLNPLSSPNSAATDGAAILTALVQTESALILAWLETGLAPDWIDDIDLDRAPLDRVPLDRVPLDRDVIAEDTRSGGNPVIPLVSQLRTHVDGIREGAGDWVHRGATGQDILDTALMLVAQRALSSTVAHLRATASDLAVLAEKHRHTPMVGRTLTQHAAPITFGAKAASWLDGVIAAVHSGMLVEVERPAGVRHAEWLALRSLLRLAIEAAEVTSTLVKFLVVPSERMARNLDASVGPARSEQAHSLRTPEFGRSAASAIVSRAVAVTSNELSFGAALAAELDGRGHRRRVGTAPAHHDRGIPMTVPVVRSTIDPAAPSVDFPQLLVLGPSLGTTSSLWQRALAEFEPTVRVLRFDLPGCGASPVATEPFAMAELADAVVRLVDTIGGGRFHYAGVSLGGAIGIELALRHPQRLLSLGIFCSAAKIGTAEGWTGRVEQVRTQGTPSLVAATPSRWFADDFIAREPAAASTILKELSETDDASYIVCCEALATFDRSADVAAIAAPTLVVSGESDPVTTPADLESLASRIPGARSVELAGASHLAALERPTEAAALLHRLITMPKSAPCDQGMHTRRAVLGDTHVDAAQAKITPETADFQEFITRYARGDIWSRPGLSRRDRSIATLASLVTGSHENGIARTVFAEID